MPAGHFQRRRASSRGPHSAGRPIITAGVFFGVLAAGLLIGQALILRSPRVPPNMYRGVVLLPPDKQGPCEQFEYDNRTGWAAAKTARPCDDNPLPSRLPGSTAGRLTGMGDQFRSK
jgi:hypothetical protein